MYREATTPPRPHHTARQKLFVETTPPLNDCVTPCKKLAATHPFTSIRLLAPASQSSFF
jgi:hypothetical protein